MSDAAPMTEMIRVVSLVAGDSIATDHGRHGLTYDVVRQVALLDDEDNPDAQVMHYLVEGEDSPRTMLARSGGRFPQVRIKRRASSSSTTPTRAPRTPESPEVLGDGTFGPMTTSNLFAERILRLPPDQARAEIATIIRALWEFQRPGGHPVYPSLATRQRWAQTARDLTAARNYTYPRKRA